MGGIWYLFGYYLGVNCFVTMNNNKLNQQAQDPKLYNREKASKGSSYHTKLAETQATKYENSWDLQGRLKR
jgi:hypothetical protein